MYLYSWCNIVYNVMWKHLVVCLVKLILAISFSKITFGQLGLGGESLINHQPSKISYLIGKSNQQDTTQLSNPMTFDIYRNHLALRTAPHSRRWCKMEYRLWQSYRMKGCLKCHSQSLQKGLAISILILKRSSWGIIPMISIWR